MRRGFIITIIYDPLRLLREERRQRKATKHQPVSVQVAGANITGPFLISVFATFSLFLYGSILTCNTM